ncbi:MAG: radical SAM protein [Elusimicrobia bacterium]|nr:radical SAM protein [Elusimicrobiota bacterium]
MTIRPPAERDSFLLPVTTGCSANTCSFCGAYQGMPFSILEYPEIESEIEKYSRVCPNTKRVFLLDGDALVLSNSKLLPVLEKLNKTFPELSRVSSYANGYNITKKSDTELKEISDNKLTLIYMGLESGNQNILNRCKKSSSVQEMIEAVSRASDAGIKSSVIVLLGLGGRKYSKEHVTDTIKALNKMQPRYLSFLSLMLIPDTPLYKEAKKGDFEELTPAELVKETYDIIEGLELKKTIFRSNHASNHLPLEGRFPNDKKNLLNMLESAIKGKKKLKPEWLRGL